LSLPGMPDNSGVFPTCVGVFLAAITSSVRFRRSSPHAWGVSNQAELASMFVRSSPPVVGCFRDESSNICPGVVFPTCVGVFLADMAEVRTSRCLPHARGGVSGFCKVEISRGSVFPTRVGVFLQEGSMS